MSERMTISPELVRELYRANASLLDSDELSAPSYYRPEWPERGPEPIVEDIRLQTEAASSKLAGNELEFYQARTRAVDYLYGRGEEAVDKARNPLVDVLALIVSAGDIHPERTLQLAIEGEPVPAPFLAKVEVSKKPYERTVFGENGRSREARTIARFGYQLSTILRGLYLLSETSRQSPLILETSLGEFAQKFAGGETDVEGLAVGLLEVLHNLELKLDRRFYHLADHLRDIVVDGCRDYQGLKDKYSYSVVEDKHFWYRGETNYAERRKASYVRTENNTREPKLHRKLSFDIPRIDDWGQVSKKRHEIVRNLKGLTLFNSIKASAVGFSEEKAIRRVVGDRLKKAGLLEEVRNLERKSGENLRRQWRNFIEREMGEEAVVGPEEEKLILRVTQDILNFFAKDTALSQKAKTNITRIGEDKYYQIDVSALAKDAVFSWVLYLRNPYVRKAFGEAVRDPQNTEAFYLLLKLVVFDVLRKSLGKKELDFLFDPQYLLKLNPERLADLYEDIEIEVARYVPDVGAIFKDILPRVDGEIADLTSPETLSRLRKRLASLTYRFLLGRFALDKAYAFTKEDRKTLKKWAKQLLLLGLLSTLASQLPEAVQALAPLAEKLGRIQTPRARAIQESEAMRALNEAIERTRQEALSSLSDNDKAAIAAVMDRIFRQNGPVANEYARADSLTRSAAEQQRMPGEIGDRIPDAIRNPEDALPGGQERAGLRSFGRIYHLPEGRRFVDGTTVGYFPWDINLQFRWEKDLDTAWYFSEHTVPINVHEVDTIDRQIADFKPNQLAYSLNGVNPEMYPPIGWRFVEVYQVGGAHPVSGPMGELYFHPDKLPQDAVFVLEPTGLTEINSRIKVYDELRTEPVYFPHSWQDGYNDWLTKALANDPAIQDIHRRFIEETEGLYKRWQEESGFLTEQYYTEYSEIGIKYAREYARYTEENRFYALGFQYQPTYGGDTLVSLANQPESGYFCSVAAFAFRDFMSSAGFLVGNQPGITLTNHQGYLWGNQAHMNSVVFLPDGRILEIDMTPNADGRTPVSDLEYLYGRVVTPKDIEEAIRREQPEAPSGEQEKIDDDMQARRMVAEYRRLENLKENNNYLSDDDVNRRLAQIREGAREILKGYISQRAASGQSIDTLTENNSVYETLKGIIANAEMIEGGKPTMQDIQLGKAEAQEIYEDYRRLEEIEAMAERLKQTDFNMEAIEAIQSQAQSIRQDMERLAESEINEGKQYAERLENFERLYQEYFDKTGYFPGQNSDDRWYDQFVDLTRFNNERIADLPISDIDLAIFNHDVLGLLESVLDRLANERGLRSGVLPDGAELKGRLPAGGLTMDEFSGLDWSSANLRLSEYREMTFNRPEIYEQLSPEAKKTLNDLYSMRNRMDEIIDGKTDLTDRQEYQELREIQGRVRSFREEMESIISPEPEPKKPFLTAEQSEDVSKGILIATAGASVAVLALTGLAIYKGVKSEKKRMKMIEEALAKGGRLSKLEKDIALSALGRICYLGYDPAFAQKAARIVGLLSRYEKEKHAEAVSWLVEQGADVLYASGVADSFYRLAGLTNGRARGNSREEILRYFPEEVTKTLIKLDEHAGGGNGHQKAVDIPGDYQIIHGLADLVLGRSIKTLHNEVMKRLGQEDETAKKTAVYKIDEFRDYLKRRYAAGEIPAKAMPLLNVVLLALEAAPQVGVDVKIAD